MTILKYTLDKYVSKGVDWIYVDQDRDLWTRQTNLNFVRFQVLTAASMKIRAYRDMARVVSE
jgi:hypothetical protein